MAEMTPQERLERLEGEAMAARTLLSLIFRRLALEDAGVGDEFVELFRDGIATGEPSSAFRAGARMFLETLLTHHPEGLSQLLKGQDDTS